MTSSHGTIDWRFANPQGQVVRWEYGKRWIPVFHAQKWIPHIKSDTATRMTGLAK